MTDCNRFTSKKTNGFTILEAMIAVLLLTVLLAVGVPNLTTWTEESRIKKAASELQADLWVARSTAIRLNCPVSVVPIDSNFQNGWEVVYNARSATDPRCFPAGGAGTPVRNVIKAQTESYPQITVTTPAIYQTDGVVFEYDGRSSNANDASAILISPSINAATIKSRCIYLSPSGRANVQIDFDYDSSDECQ